MSSMRSMRALSFFFALMVGLVLAFLTPAFAGVGPMAPEAMTAPQASAEPLSGPDELAVELMPVLEFDAAPGVDPLA